MSGWLVLANVLLAFYGIMTICVGAAAVAVAPGARTYSIALTVLLWPLIAMVLVAEKIAARGVERL
jgi:hypothetical protein